MRTKVLYIDTPLDPPGGGQVSLLSILRSLDSRSFEALVFLSAGGSFAASLAESSIPAEIVPLSRLFFRIRDFRPAIIHCNSSTGRYTFTAAAAAWLLGIPFIWHNRVIDTAGWKERLTAALSSKILVISGAVGAKFFWCAHKVIKIHNAVDTELFSPGLVTARLRDEFALRPGDMVIGVFSRLEPWKGHALFLRAAAIIAGEEARVRFLVVGEGPEKSRLAALAGELGLKERVFFTGFRADIPELMNLCDIVVNPSEEPEPFGRTIIEAMSCGKPVIATAGGGPEEIIEDGVDGVLVRPETGALAEAMRALLTGGRLPAAEIAARARRKVLARFGIKAHAASLADIYRKVMEEK